MDNTSMAAGVARALPSGTVTFLFTDVERSTQTVGEMGDESYAEVQDLHRKLLRDAFAANSGVEVGTEGDAFFVAFAKAGDAVAAAVDGQRALAEGSELRVRMGIHTGEAVVRDENYVGHDVHRAKRVCDAGHGGQILLSQTTADLIRRSGVIDLGPHRLKDLEEPQHLYQVTADGLERDFPPLRSLESFVHNLPPSAHRSSVENERWPRYANCCATTALLR
jgi:class 3 adenylate cyclase